MNKLSKTWAAILLVLVAYAVGATLTAINATTANAKLRSKIGVYMQYYCNAEHLFDEIEDYNEAMFDTDKAEDYLQARSHVKDIDSSYTNYVERVK